MMESGSYSLNSFNAIFKIIVQSSQQKSLLPALGQHGGAKPSCPCRSNFLLEDAKGTAEHCGSVMAEAGVSMLGEHLDSVRMSGSNTISIQHIPRRRSAWRFVHHHLWHHSAWVPLLAPAPESSYLLMQNLGWRLTRSSQLPAHAPLSNYCKHLGSEPADRDLTRELLFSAISLTVFHYGSQLTIRHSYLRQYANQESKENSTI